MASREKRRLQRIRAEVIERDGQACCYCSKSLLLEEITMDHIVPASQKGSYNTTNLTVACAPCNNKRGSRPFFEFIEEFNFNKSKIKKYKRLYNTNLKIKVLNLAKESLLHEDYAIPQSLIEKACQILRIKPVCFKEWQEYVEIKLEELVERSKIKYNFEKLIKIIELTAHGIVAHDTEFNKEKHMIKPLYDQVVVERAEAEKMSLGGIVIPTTVLEKSQEAYVRAVGNGRLLENGQVYPLQVKVGDKVLLAKHTYTEVKVDGKDMLVVREDAILAVLDA